jgi:hypothetical protein
LTAGEISPITDPNGTIRRLEIDMAASDPTDLIKYITARNSLLNVSLSYCGADAASPEHVWGCSAQWETDGEGCFKGRGVVSASGPDPISAILDCAGLVAIKQAGVWPVRSAPALQAVA